MFRKPLILFTVAILVLFSVALIVPITLSAPPDTRMIVDHTHEVYIAPQCFDQADTTNYLEETTWGGAQSTDYSAESECTDQAMTDEGVPIIHALLQTLGVIPSKWDHPTYFG
ncbi:hypothetical protein [Salsuginibacillus kocurii]|uniref:hypothetical protein n=1 Tax=Salsuginibacillus kocurii TaxID=427078 RepID=UPI00037DE1DB|nr:hypothetical protein [Salsuginibacillus kocurii]